MRNCIKLSAVALVSIFALCGITGTEIGFRLGTAFASSLSAMLQQKGPDKLTFNEGKRPGKVTFDHKTHQTRAQELGKGCVTCHHTTTNAKIESETPAKCSSCHLERGNAKNPKVDGKEKWIREAFHTRCMGCHKENKKGPTKCMKCHVK